MSVFKTKENFRKLVIIFFVLFVCLFFITPDKTSAIDNWYYTQDGPIGSNTRVVVDGFTSRQLCLDELETVDPSWNPSPDCYLTGDVKITSFSPSEGKIGDVITIDGESFLQIKNVFFNTAQVNQAGIFPDSPVRIRVTVPTGATTGKIIVKTESHGQATSIGNFTVKEDPTTIEGNGNPTETDSDIFYTPLAPLPGLEGPIDTSEDCAFGKYLNIIIKIFLGICAVLAMIMIVIGGIEYMTSELPSSKGAGKKTIMQAIFGLLLALGAYLILNTINPNLLNTCLNNMTEVTIKVSPEQEEIIKKRTGSGNCVVVTDSNSACYPDKLKSSFTGNTSDPAPFDTLAAQASAICQLESSGVVNMPVGRSPNTFLDKCSDNKPFSFGLFQINAIAHRNTIPACQSAFEIPAGHGTNQGNCLERAEKSNYCLKWSCTTVEPYYTQCQNYLINPINNIKYAATSPNLNRWSSWTTYNSCKDKF